jgi:dTDP-glucose pyrophosphorylase/CBS domain-containing protein
MDRRARAIRWAEIMKSWERVLIGPDTTLREALETIERGGAQMALVASADRRLLGTLTDGDLRRALLKGQALSDKVTGAMFSTPTCARVGEDRNAILATMRRLGLHQVPVVDAAGIVVGLETVDDFLAAPARDNWVVVMAGGLGQRLEELTRNTPKPMLKVGPRPLMETIVRGYADQGFKQFYFAVNYKAEQIEAHFGDGSALGVEIRYLRETQRMGTAGALSLIPEAPRAPFFVTNADLLMKENFGYMLDRHIELDADGTMAVRAFEMQVPFGVVRERDGSIEAIEEKPIERYVVNAGIYILSPKALELVPRDRLFDMPSLFSAMVSHGMQTRCHHIDGYWLDIGRMPDYERANLDFAEVLG